MGPNPLIEPELPGKRRPGHRRDWSRGTEQRSVEPDGMKLKEMAMQRHLSHKMIADRAGMPAWQVKRIFKGTRCGEEWYTRVLWAIEQLGVSTPLTVEAPRKEPETPVFKMSSAERMALAGNPEHWAWLAHEYLEGTDGQPLRLMWFHIEVLQQLFMGGKVVVNLPTDHMKSEISSFVFPIFSLMNNPNESHIICGANINDSKRRVQKIQRELETNVKLTMHFPWLRKPDRSSSRQWGTVTLTVEGRTTNKPNPSVYAVAVGSGDIRGRRGKLIMDDIEGDKHRWSQLARMQLYDFVKLEAIRCFESPNETKRPLLAALGTPFTVDSLYFKLESQGWRTIRYPIYREDGNLLWPEKAQKVHDARNSMKKSEFAIAYLMDPTGGDTSILSEAEIRKLMDSAEEAATNARVFVSLDPASGNRKSERDDYAGISVVRIDWRQGEELPKLQVLRAYKYREGLFEQVHLCAELAKEFASAQEGNVDGPLPVIIEGNSQQASTYRSTFSHTHPEIPVILHYTTAQNKPDEQLGLSVLKRLLRRHKLHVPEQDAEEEGIQTLREEIRDLGTGAHDHIACSVWFCLWHMYQQVKLYTGPSLQSSYQNRTRFGSNSFGFGWRMRDPVQQAINEEQERFRRQLSGGRA